MTFIKKHLAELSIATLILVFFSTVTFSLVVVASPKPVAVNKTNQGQEKTTDAQRREKQSIIVAGGCFWCVESDFELVPGVSEVTSGYINGTTENPTYRQVSSKITGHFEAVKIEYYPAVVSTEKLVDYFWRTIDPTDNGGQFCDRGSPYLTGLFYQNDQQKQIFEASLKKVNLDKPFKDPIVTPIQAAKTFYPAEDYHQDYYVNNTLRYQFYRKSCRRDQRIQQLWGEIASKQYH